MVFVLGRPSGQEARDRQRVSPTLIYRAETKEIEEVERADIPLGYSTRFKCEERRLDLHPGDVILMKSDGLPERLNADDDELGYPKTYEAFKELVEQPQRIPAKVTGTPI
jgi:serine phosphatase RsbU (regulator of sigma subunit)